MKLKAIYSVALMMAVAALLALSVPVHASEMDSRIELSAKQSYVFKTYLQGDDIKIQSSDGVVSLTGTVSEDSHKSLADETVAGLPGVKSVDNRLEVKGAPPTANSDAWFHDKVKATLGEMSPINHVAPGLPPFLLIHGTMDKAVPYQQSLNFQAKLKEIGVPCDIITITNAPHNITTWETLDTSYKEEMVLWLKRALGGVK